MLIFKTLAKKTKRQMAIGVAMVMSVCTLFSGFVSREKVFANPLFEGERAIGYGSQTTGGEGARPENIYRVKTKAELMLALSKNAPNASDLTTPRIIILENDIHMCSRDGIDYFPGITDPSILPWKNGSNIAGTGGEGAVYKTEVSNVTILGKENGDNGPGKTIYGGGLKFANAENIVIRYVNFEDAYDFFPKFSGGEWNTEPDNLTIESVKNLWIDHCTFSDGKNLSTHGVKNDINYPIYHDGLLDIKRASDNITISNSVFKDHDKAVLIGHSDSEAGDANSFHVTMYGNYFKDINQRQPRVRYGHIHAFNNVYEGTKQGSTLYVFGGGNNGSIFSEANIFKINQSDIDTGKAEIIADYTKNGVYYFEEAGSSLNSKQYGPLTKGSNKPIYDDYIKPNYDYTAVDVLNGKDSTVYGEIVNNAGHGLHTQVDYDVVSIREVAIREGTSLSTITNAVANLKQGRKTTVKLTWNESLNTSVPGSYKVKATIRTYNVDRIITVPVRVVAHGEDMNPDPEANKVAMDYEKIIGSSSIGDANFEIVDKKLHLSAADGKTQTADDNGIFAYIPVTGSFTMTGRVSEATALNSSNFRSMLMVKNGLESTSKSISIGLRASSGGRELRLGNFSTSSISGLKAGYYFRIQRNGNQFKIEYSLDGITYTTNNTTVDANSYMGGANSTAYVGVFVCAGSSVWSELKIRDDDNKLIFDLAKAHLEIQEDEDAEEGNEGEEGDGSTPEDEGDGSTKPEEPGDDEDDGSTKPEEPGDGNEGDGSDKPDEPGDEQTPDDADFDASLNDSNLNASENESGSSSYEKDGNYYILSSNYGKFNVSNNTSPSSMLFANLGLDGNVYNNFLISAKVKFVGSVTGTGKESRYAGLMIRQNVNDGEVAPYFATALRPNGKETINPYYSTVGPLKEFEFVRLKDQETGLEGNSIANGEYTLQIMKIGNEFTAFIISSTGKVYAQESVIVEMNGEINMGLFVGEQSAIFTDVRVSELDSNGILTGTAIFDPAKNIRPEGDGSTKPEDPENPGDGSDESEEGDDSENPEEKPEDGEDSEGEDEEPTNPEEPGETPEDGENENPDDSGNGGEETPEKPEDDSDESEDGENEEDGSENPEENPEDGEEGEDEEPGETPEDGENENPDDSENEEEETPENPDDDSNESEDDETPENPDETPDDDGEEEGDDSEDSENESEESGTENGSGNGSTDKDKLPETGSMLDLMGLLMIACSAIAAGFGIKRRG